MYHGYWVIQQLWRAGRLCAWVKGMGRFVWALSSTWSFPGFQHPFLTPIATGLLLQPLREHWDSASNKEKNDALVSVQDVKPVSKTFIFPGTFYCIRNSTRVPARTPSGVSRPRPNTTDANHSTSSPPRQKWVTLHRSRPWLMGWWENLDWFRWFPVNILVDILDWWRGENHRKPMFFPMWGWNTIVPFQFESHVALSTLGNPFGQVVHVSCLGCQFEGNCT